MLHSMTEQNIEPERFVLPPISTLNEYIPNKSNKKQTLYYNLLSPPNSITPSTTSPTSSSSGRSPVMAQHPPSPPRLGFEKMDLPIYPIGTNQQETPINNNNNNILRTISSDVDQVVQHAHSLCENMIHYKPYLLSSSLSPPSASVTNDELRPWMDDMIGKANQVLNALLRLRKHQMVSDNTTTTTITGTSSSPTLHNKSSPSAAAKPTIRRYSDQHPSYPYPYPHQRSSSIPSSSTINASSSLSSSRITITKRDWPNITTTTTQQQYHHQPYHHQQQQSNMNHSSNVSIPSRQRKRGKRASFQGRCHSCNISETPEWRRGPDGARTLCNACGLHYAKLARKKAAAAASSSTT